MSIKQTLHKANQLWLRYEYKHTTIAAVVILLFIVFIDSTLVSAILNIIEHTGYFGAFVTGILTVSFFTTVPAFVLLLGLAQVLDPVALAIVAGAGAMVGDWLLMMFFEDRIVRELRPLLQRLHIRRTVNSLRRRYTSWILLVGGAIALATPIPDEIGVALLGISRFQQRYLLIICFTLNTLGILGIVLAARAIVP